MHTDRHSDALTQICTTCTRRGVYCLHRITHACGMRVARACNVERCTFVYCARAPRFVPVAGMAGGGNNYANSDNNSIELIWECARHGAINS
jgi:hypothetical protein